MHVGSIDLDRQVLLVAEIGNNHEGDFGVAKELIRCAAEAGVQAVKFQTYRTRDFVRPSDTQRVERLQRYELTSSQFEELAGLAHASGLLFLSTPLDLRSAQVLAPIVDAYKIASGDNDFLALIDVVCDSDKPVIVSSGASYLERLVTTTDYIRARWQRRGVTGRLAVLHCVSSYPVPNDEANLASIPYLAASLDAVIGYSDHTIGIDAAVAAVAAGARIIEKHFTLDKSRTTFRDHQLSADVEDMKALVAAVHATERLLGRPGKTIQPCERDLVRQIRRSIVAASDLPAGHRLSAGDLTWMRPGDGFPPGTEAQLIGRLLKHSIRVGEPILEASVD